MMEFMKYGIVDRSKKRITERDEFNNADIIGMEMENLLALDGVTLVELTDALNKLADYEDAEEQGRLLHLPCKIGEKIYSVETGPCKSKERRCPDPNIDCEECKYNSHIFREIHFRMSCLDEGGKLRGGLFVNRDEAEAYLKELEG